MTQGTAPARHGERHSRILSVAGAGGAGIWYIKARV